MNSRKYFRITLLVLVLAFSIGSFVTGCGPKPQEMDPIVIASKQFAENNMLAHMAAILIEENTDYPVDISKIGMGPTELLHPAMVAEQIDIYPEYTGTSWMVVLAETEVIMDRQEIFERVRDSYAEQYKITSMNPLGFQNTFAIAMKRELAEELNISKISDLANHPNLIMVGDTETFTRPDVYLGLAKAYGLDLQAKTVDTAFFYEALAQDLGHVTTAFSTDGRLKEYDFVVLADDKSFFPPYDAYFKVRSALFEKYPTLQATLEVLSGAIDAEMMTELNYRVEVLQEDPATVARDFLTVKGFI